MTDDIGKDLEALRPLPTRLAELTSDLRKLATCGQPTCLERRALSMLEELGLELAQPGSALPVLLEHLRTAERALLHYEGYGTALRAVQAALATIPDSGLWGMAAIPGKPTPEREITYACAKCGRPTDPHIRLCPVCYATTPAEVAQ